MTTKSKLTELLEEAAQKMDCPQMDEVAEYLIANGVTVESKKYGRHPRSRKMLHRLASISLFVVCIWVVLCCTTLILAPIVLSVASGDLRILLFCIASPAVIILTRWACRKLVNAIVKLWEESDRIESR